jgi:tetratricopeptide (TPR) repeat protein
MKSKLTIGIISSMLLTFLTPTSINAQASGDIGTNRKQQTCSSRSEPRKGQISAAQAKKYAICEAEGDKPVKNPGFTDFIDISSLQVNPKPRRGLNSDISYFGNDIIDSPVYELTGTAIQYSCASPSGGLYTLGKNCLVTRADNRGPNNSSGACVKKPSGEWRCVLTVNMSSSYPSSEQGPPPSANAPSSSEPQIATNNSAQYYHDQTAIKRQKKNYQGALTDISRAIQIEPNNAHFYYDRAVIKYDLNDRGGAIKDLQQSAKLYQQEGNTKEYEATLRTIENIKK